MIDQNQIDVLLKEYRVNLEEVLMHKKFSSSTRLLAANLIETPYHTVGQYLKSLSKSELDYLCELSEIIENDSRVDELIVLTLMLLQAEGTPCATEDEFLNHIGSFKMMIAGTALQRKGLIKVNYENISFNDDMSDKIVFEPIDE